MGGNEKLRKYITVLMRKEGITIEKLAKLSGVSSASIYRFINGNKAICINGADKLLAVFGLEIKIGKGEKRNEQGTAAGGTA